MGEASFFRVGDAARRLAAEFHTIEHTIPYLFTTDNVAEEMSSHSPHLRFTQEQIY